MKLTLKIWRQASHDSQGGIHTYELDDVSEDMSFLEMLDVLNEQLNEAGEEPVAFDSDCREGICGQCGLMIDGEAHGPEVTTTCQLHMRTFKDGDTITVDSTCKIGPYATSSHAVITGDFNSAYTVKVVSKQEGPAIPGMPPERTMTIDAKWAGACKADQKPGDMIMAGRKLNVRDLQNLPTMPGAPARPGSPAQKK